jgi:hypothetical protein
VDCCRGLNPDGCEKNKSIMTLIRLTIFLLIAAILPKDLSGAGEYSRIIIQTGETPTGPEKNIAALLASRLGEYSGIRVLLDKPLPEPMNDDDLLILLGTPENHSAIRRRMETSRIPPLTSRDPGKEGFLLKAITESGMQVVIAAGVDERGCLYATGELLRQLEYGRHRVSLPEALSVRTAPAFEIRGTQFGQSHVARNVAKVRNWTEEETRRVIIDYALAGANTFTTPAGPTFDFIRSFGLLTQGGFGANTGGQDLPGEWEASESIGRKGYVCLSVPEARSYMLKKCEDYFKDSPSFDLVKFHGGDGGGCECDKCKPYGLTFILTVEEMAGIIHRYHPETRIYFTNQKFDNEDDIAIFNYLNQQPRAWLWAWGYGPGSDATSWQPGHRQNHRMDLFHYPGFGPYGLYPREIIRQIPSRHKLLYYNEITHWRYAQHGYIQMYPRADKNGDLPPHWSHEIYERRPDQYLTMVYDRLTFFAWPRYYHRVFNDLMPFGNGDITHSSGHHDHFNQWMWQRLLWSPRLDVEKVVGEYCTTWFGREAAPLMAKAIFQLEENLQEIPGVPLTRKEGVDRYYDLVKQAGEIMPLHIMEKNWLWRMYMQKGALDKYIKLAVRQQEELQKRIELHISMALGETDPGVDPVLEALSWFDELNETEEMARLRKEAGKLGEESNELFGKRSEGFFNLEQDFIGLGWLKRQLERALASSSERKPLIRMIIHYEDPGEGGFYDNLGTFNPAPNAVSGYPYDHGQPYVKEMLSDGNRPSQRSMHFTQDEDQGVTLHYKDLDPDAEYTVRFTFVRPWYQDRYADRMNQRTQSIYANDILLAENVELPLQMSDFFTWDIPQKITRQGELTISLKKADDVARGSRVETEQWRNSGGWGTIVSEVWLMKKQPGAD